VDQGGDQFLSPTDDATEHAPRTLDEEMVEFEDQFPLIGAMLRKARKFLN
jgi:hypothetical protein